MSRSTPVELGPLIESVVDGTRAAIDRLEQSIRRAERRVPLPRGWHYTRQVDTVWDGQRHVIVVTSRAEIDPEPAMVTTMALDISCDQCPPRLLFYHRNAHSVIVECEHGRTVAIP